AERREVEAFLFAFDSNLAPVVGQQVTLAGSNARVASPRIALLEARADAGECDLVAKGWLGRQELGFLYVGAGQFITAGRAGEPTSDAQLRLLGTQGGRALTFTCLPPGEGTRVAFER